MNRTLTRTVGIANRHCQARFQTTFPSASINPSKSIALPLISDTPKASTKNVNTSEVQFEANSSHSVRIAEVTFQSSESLLIWRNGHSNSLLQTSNCEHGYQMNCTKFYNNTQLESPHHYLELTRNIARSGGCNSRYCQNQRKNGKLILKMSEIIVLETCYIGFTPVEDSGSAMMHILPTF